MFMFAFVSPADDGVVNVYAYSSYTLRLRLLKGTEGECGEQSFCSHTIILYSLTVNMYDFSMQQNYLCRAPCLLTNEIQNQNKTKTFMPSNEVEYMTFS